jgi:outer membrane receptor protein involved in Fe transport
MTDRNSPNSMSKLAWSSCATALCTLAAPLLHAQNVPQTETSRTSGVLEEVMVTADRQNAVEIQKAPIAISVVNTEELSRQGAQGYGDYVEATPSVFLQESGPGQNQFVIRGMSISNFNHTTLHDRSLVSVYLDDTPISLQGNTPDLKIFDLERVEIIRGPQGTLYGASAMAGNIRFISKKPQFDRVAATAETTVSQSEDGGTDYSVRGMANLPVSDTVALRINAYQADNSGYIDNVGLNKKDANGNRSTQARAVLRFQPSDQLTVDASHTFARLRSDGSPEVRRFVDDPSGRFDTNNTNLAEAYNDDFNLTNVTASYDFGAAELISSSSYIDRDFDRLTSGQYLVGRRGLGFDTIPWDQIDSRNDIQNKLTTFTQEVRLQSRGDGRLKWITGAYFERTRRAQLQDIPTANYDALAFGGLLPSLGLSSSDLGTPHDDDPFFGDTDIEERQWAVFGEATYTLLPKLDVTLGARYFEHKQDFDLYFAGILGIDFDTFGPLSVRETLEDDDINPRLRVAYQATDDLMFFAEAAQGFRLGGTNQPLPVSCGESGPLTFDSDRVWTYQLGGKSSWLDDRLIVNLTAYLNDWEDVQTNRVLDQCSYLYTTNGGKIRGDGLELESKAQLTQQLLFSLNASYNRTEANGDLRFPSQFAGGPDIIIALDGQRAPGTPEYSGSAALDYAIPVFSAATISLHASYQMREGFYAGWDTRAFNPTAVEPDFLPLDRRLDLALNYLSGGAWEAGLFVRNATDEEEILSEGSSRRRAPNPDYETRTIGRGRTVGVRFRYDF